ncbi:cytochrome c5 family protein [Azoarcus sp. KH32C]|uniref:c-type cytochrome n=1 Tax=Azoarcus sp. KH32C TaxID=748247 RepID=UPI000238634F|nr:c-type cytochrome [Azoarcus sp. KH32C]BAL22494.1 cytochrome c, class I [Azoarcus sp. KH32C]
MSRSFFPARRRVLVPALATLAAVQLAACSKTQDDDVEARARRIEPVAHVTVKVQKAAPGSRTGEQVYQGTCAGCHGAGALGSPKFSDAGAWGPRIAQGFDTLAKHAIEGIRQMPPRGGGVDLTDTEVKRAVAYMANAGGAKFTEPAVEK